MTISRASAWTAFDAEFAEGCGDDAAREQFAVADDEVGDARGEFEDRRRGRGESHRASRTLRRFFDRAAQSAVFLTSAQRRVAMAAAQVARRGAATHSQRRRVAGTSQQHPAAPPAHGATDHPATARIGRQHPYDQRSRKRRPTTEDQTALAPHTQGLTEAATPRPVQQHGVGKFLRAVVIRYVSSTSRSRPVVRSSRENSEVSGTAPPPATASAERGPGQRPATSALRIGTRARFQSVSAMSRRLACGSNCASIRNGNPIGRTGSPICRCPISSAN